MGKQDGLPVLSFFKLVDSFRRDRHIKHSLLVHYDDLNLDKQPSKAGYSPTRSNTSLSSINFAIRQMLRFNTGACHVIFTLYASYTPLTWLG